MIREYLDWLPSIILLIILAAGYVFRHAFQLWISSGIQHHFGKQIEVLRNDLRAKEEKINALRQGALANAAKRREALDKRKLEAVDKLWSATIALGQLKIASKYMQVVNFEESAKAAPKDPKVRQLFELLGKHIDISKIQPVTASTERPYLSNKAWALFSAYQAILLYAVFQMKLLEFGEDKNILDHKNVGELVQAALPHQSSFLEQHGVSACHFLVDELEQKLLDELKANLNETAPSEEDIRNAAQILSFSEALMANIDTSTNA
jgi:hypothetical protein